MNTHIVTQTDLEEMLGYVRPGDIAKWLRDNQIKYFYERGRIFTTVRLIEAAAGLVVIDHPDYRNPEPIL
jgi:hypothetical protein